jgi:hypothetical protein
MSGAAQGPSDVAFLDGKLYVLQDIGSAARRFPERPNGVYVVEADGSLTLVADARDWLRVDPVDHPPFDQTSEGEPFAMIAGDHVLWVLESNSGQLLKVTPDGESTRIADLSEGHLVPTGLAAAPGGGVYVGFLTSAPYTDGSSKVIEIDQEGDVSTVWTGLTMLTALAVGPAGDLYALEMSTLNAEESPYTRPNSGRIVKRAGPDSLSVVAAGLDYPIAMDMGTDGALYVSTPAYGPNADTGGIVRIDLGANQPVMVAPDIVRMSNCAGATPESTRST